MDHKAFLDGLPRRAMCDFEKSIVAVLAKHLPWTEVRNAIQVLMLYQQHPHIPICWGGEGGSMVKRF